MSVSSVSVSSRQQQKLVTLWINLVDSQPEIWRLFRVPSAISLASLHSVIQDVMGWSDTHLHQFVSGNTAYADPACELDARDSRKVALSAILRKPGDVLQYDYDFGDCREHRLVATAFSQGTLDHAECLAGKRCCPPDDIGGVRGYEQFIEAISDPDHEEHEEMTAWCAEVTGGDYDPEDFDVEQINEALEQRTLSLRFRA